MSTNYTRVNAVWANTSAGGTEIDADAMNTIEAGIDTLADELIVEEARAAAAEALLQPLDADLTALAAISGVRGDIIYRNASTWTRLAAGTSGHFLKTLGSGADPAWAAATDPAVSWALWR